MSKLYEQLGASAHKDGVHNAIKNSDKGLFPGAFCKLVPDHLSNARDHALAIHADGVGTKSIIAYLYWRETGDASVFRTLAQDSLVMNIDDLLCVGATGPFVFSNTIGRNRHVIPDDILPHLIGGYDDFVKQMAAHNIELLSCGGETADMGDSIRTLVMDSTVMARVPLDAVIDNGKITGGLAIIGLGGFGQTTYETTTNSSMGSNGLTLARHVLLSDHYKRYTESLAPENLPHAYRGPHRLSDPLPNTNMTIGQALLSPTRSFAPFIKTLLANHKGAIKGLIHASGGGLTKCLHFGSDVHYIKDNIFGLPPLFAHVRAVGNLSFADMVATFNCGGRFEIYCDPAATSDILTHAKTFNIPAQQIGHTVATTGRHLTIQTPTDKLEMSR